MPKIFKTPHIQRKLKQVRNQKRQLITLQFLASALEYYDFFSFTFVFFYLLRLFNHRIIELYGIAAVGLISFLFRPVGYRIFLNLAKKYDRPTIITTNSIMMTLSIVLTGLMPVNANSSVFSTFACLIVGRIIHGISFGIKLQANLFYIKRIFPKRLHSNLAISIMGAQLGLSCAIFINKLLYTHLTTAQMEWGWRIPFFIGGGLSLVLYITRMIIFKPRLRYDNIEKLQPLDKVAFKSGKKLWLSLVIASSRACTMFTLFVIVPGMLNWLLGWRFKEITDIMLAATIASSSMSWLFRQIRIDSRQNFLSLIIGLILIIPSSILFGISLWQNHKELVIFSILILSSINGFLFVIIPKFIEGLCRPEERLEVMLFINNYEFFHFNLIRRGALFIAAVIFGAMIPTAHYLEILVYSLSLTAISSLIAIWLIKIVQK